MRKKIIDKKILKLAYDTTNFGLKNKTKFFASHKNKKCGDRILIELEIKNKKVKKMYYETDGCIFCQASASLLSKNIKNTLLKNLDKLVLSQKFKFLLSNKYLSRRDCIMLPYQALKKII